MNRGVSPMLTCFDRPRDFGLAEPLPFGYGTGTIWPGRWTLESATVETGSLTHPQPLKESAFLWRHQTTPTTAT